MAVASTPVSISRQVARWTAGLRYEDLPSVVVDKVNAAILLVLAGAVLGAPKRGAQDAIAMIRREEAKADGATILTDGSKATRVGAAFANAEIIHSSKMFDSYRMLTHPGLALVPAALANAELERSSGKQLITALAAGYEFLCRLCDDMIPSTAARGFRPSPLYCTRGTALVTGTLMGLDEDALVACIALAANAAAGLNEGPRSGGTEGSLHEAQAARHGIFAAMLARGGHVKGSERAIEGEAGFLNAFTGNNQGRLSYAFTGPLATDLGEITRDLGQQFKLLGLMFKIYPVAGFNQPVIELIGEMQRDRKFNAGDIERVDVAMNWLETLYPSPEFPRFVDWQKPRTDSLATHFVVAQALVNGGFPVAGGQAFRQTGARLSEDQAVLDFMRRRVHLVPEKERPMFSPGITVTLTSGETISSAYPYARLEWGFDQLAGRLRDCFAPPATGLAQHEALVAAAASTASLATVAPLIDATMPAR